MTIMTYYVLVACEHCDADCYYGPCGTTLRHRGLPVVTILEQERVDCDECGALNYLGELDVFVEGGVTRADDEDDE